MYSFVGNQESFPSVAPDQLQEKNLQSVGHSECESRLKGFFGKLVGWPPHLTFEEMETQKGK